MIKRIAAATISMIAAAVLAVVFSAPPAHAATVAIHCGKTSWTGTWQHYDFGGYVGDGCGAGIDYHVTPLGGVTGATLSYSFSPSEASGSNLHLEAWIPTIYAYSNALMDFTTYRCGLWYDDQTIDQATVGGWVTISASFSGNCDVRVIVWSGVVTPNLTVGADAIRIVG